MHQQHEFMEPDEHFSPGTFRHLVPGNEGRVLDGRRTPGFIESFDPESALFVWRITGFEDAGRRWEIPAEEIRSYQFRKDARLLPTAEAEKIEARSAEFNKPLRILPSRDAQAETDAALQEWESRAEMWFQKYSQFFTAGKALDFSAKEGEPLLYADLAAWMSQWNLLEQERTTAEQYLLNPYSGEWIKAIKITMAELGLIPYSSSPTRKPDTFSGKGEKSLLRAYILARMAFVRHFFRRAGYAEVPLYRGMSSSLDFYETPESLLSATFSPETAAEFADIHPDSPSRSAYLVKFTLPVEKLFMTFLETKEFNERYLEQEAVILHRKQKERLALN